MRKNAKIFVTLTLVAIIVLFLSVSVSQVRGKDKEKSKMRYLITAEGIDIRLLPPKQFAQYMEQMIIRSFDINKLGDILLGFKGGDAP